MSIGIAPGFARPHRFDFVNSRPAGKRLETPPARSPGFTGDARTARQLRFLEFGFDHIGFRLVCG